MHRSGWKGLLDWLCVWLVVFITVALAAFLVDTTQILTSDPRPLLARALTLATAVTVFYAATTWLRQPGSTVPKDILERLPSDPPQGSTGGTT